MRIRPTFTLTLLVALICSMLLFNTGCDRLIIIAGTVYEWVDAPENAQSKIYHKEYSAAGLLQDDLPQDIELKPLSDVYVRCFGEVSNDSFYSNEVTDSKGAFRLATSLGRRTGEYDTTVEALREGFETASKDLVDKGDSHSLTIILVRNNE